jgi:hypothetical protein
MSEKKFYVVGGEYADTAFTTAADGCTLETHGPFTETAAHEFWRDITGRTVDNAMVRYVVRAAEDLGGKTYYVVGGEYADTTFTAMAPGRDLEVYGPFERGQAMDFWRGITSQTVDSALHRYDIERRPTP